MPGEEEQQLGPPFTGSLDDVDSILEKIGVVLRERRELKFKNQREAADAMGISRTILSKLENGSKDNLTIVELYTICHHLDIDPVWVINYAVYTAEADREHERRLKEAVDRANRLRDPDDR